MLRSPRVWLYAAGGWLMLAAVAHASAHLWIFVLEHGMVGLREFAMNAMKQAQSADPLRPSLWRQFRLFSASLALLFAFSGCLDVLVARLALRPSELRAFALFGTVFWTVAFALFAFVDPVIQPLMVATIAVPLHAIAYVAASLEEVADPEPTSDEPATD